MSSKSEPIFMFVRRKCIILSSSWKTLPHYTASPGIDISLNISHLTFRSECFQIADLSSSRKTFSFPVNNYGCHFIVFVGPFYSGSYGLLHLITVTNKYAMLLAKRVKCKDYSMDVLLFDSFSSLFLSFTLFLYLYLVSFILSSFIFCVF